MARPIVHPHIISPGDTFGIFSPSEPLTAERQSRVQPSLALLAENFHYVFAPHAQQELHYVAATTDECIADINYLLNSQEVSALIASWGGKNSNRLVSKLPYDKFLAARKPVVGFSDVCVILNAISAMTGLVTFYGPNNAGELIYTKHHDFRLLQGENVPLFGYQAKELWRVIRPGQAQGRLYGGNLSTFTLGLAGSPQMAAMEDPIFFWETGSATPQIIDQYLTCLKNCGFLNSIKAMIVGDTRFEEIPRRYRPVDDLLAEYGEELNIPVLRIETFGHTRTLENPLIPIGMEIIMDTGKCLKRRLIKKDLN